MGPYLMIMDQFLKMSSKEDIDAYISDFELICTNYRENLTTLLIAHGDGSLPN